MNSAQTWGAVFLIVWAVVVVVKIRRVEREEAALQNGVNVKRPGE